MINYITVMEAHELLEDDKAIVIDVREPDEYAAAHIPGAALIPLGTLAADKIPAATGKKIIVHCRRGSRGNKACEILAAVPEVYNLTGGIEGWMNAGLPVENGSHTS